MKSCSSHNLRRARPLLGTFVEITARGLSVTRLGWAVDSAFAAVQRVHERMSFHDKTSDVSRLNRLAAKRAVAVDSWTYAVLVEAHGLSWLSGGAFDITVAPTLVAWGFLPGQNLNVKNSNASWADVDLLPRHRVRFKRALAIDLGGIAKGFAVDKAVEALQAAGVASGIVNAGGDLRVFGPDAHEIHIRHPASPGQLLSPIQLRNEAIATSAPYFSVRRHRGRAVSPLVDPSTRRPFTAPVSVSVRAPRCVLADALTKVVLGGSEAAVLACGARAIVIAEPGRAAA